MISKNNQNFSNKVIEELKYYVYRLIDPRNGETFYVGKGKGNRVFQHVRVEANLDENDENDNKINTIREINKKGLEVIHVIHRHGMNEDTALEVEAALIDAYPGLKNSVNGHRSNEFGAMHANEVIIQYEAPVADFKHKVLLINVNHSSEEKSVYDAVRYAWKLNKQNASQAELVLAVVKGVIIGVFIPCRWLEATQENFASISSENREGRIGFEGKEAPLEIQKMYMNTRVPDNYRKRGASNPVRYTWLDGSDGIVQT